MSPAGRFETGLISTISQCCYPYHSIKFLGSHRRHVFPLNFDLEEIESNRRRQVMLAATAATAPIMEMHLSLAALYQNQAAALARSGPSNNRDVIGELKLVSGERRRAGR